MLSSTWSSEVGPVFGFLATFGDSSVEPPSPHLFFLPLLWLDINTDIETVLRKGKLYPAQKPCLPSQIPHMLSSKIMYRGEEFYTSFES